ncbi:MAG: ABC transporter permease [Thermodesulfobacteriota bacterium]
MKSSFPSVVIFSSGFALIAFFLIPILSLAARTPFGKFWPILISPGVSSAIKLSLLTTSISTFLAVALGTPLAYYLARRKIMGKGLLDTLIDLPMVLPPAVAGVALLMAFGRTGILGGFLDRWGVSLAFNQAAVIMAQVFVASPLYVRAAKNGFEAINPELEKVSQTLGVGPWRTFLRVTVPLSLPSLLGGAMATWARALGEFGATLLFAGNFMGKTRTMPLAIMTAMEIDFDAAIVLSLFMVVVSFILLSMVRLAVRRNWENVGA